MPNREFIVLLEEQVVGTTELLGTFTESKPGSSFR
jgi:hypothetical protein